MACQGRRRLLQGLLLFPLGVLMFSYGWLFRPAWSGRPRVVCFGDSLTVCGGAKCFPYWLSQELKDYEIVNRGRNGERLSDGRARFAREALSLRPAAIIMSLGANDYWDRRPVSEMREDLAEMLRSARAQGVKVLLAGVFGEVRDREGRLGPKLYDPAAPAHGPQILEMERELAREYGAAHLENMQAELNRPEHWDDARHPSPLGNQLVARTILERLRPLLEAQRKK